jgi:hypothetical protein
MISLSLFLSRSSDQAREAHIRLATPDEAVRTNCPKDWSCVVVDGGMAEEAVRTLRTLVSAFEEGVAYAHGTRGARST